LTHQLHQQFAGLHADGFRQGAHGDGKGDRHLALAGLRAFQALWFAAGAAARAVFVIDAIETNFVAGVDTAGLAVGAFAMAIGSSGDGTGLLGGLALLVLLIDGGGGGIDAEFVSLNRPSEIFDTALARYEIFGDFGQFAWAGRGWSLRGLRPLGGCFDPMLFERCWRLNPDHSGASHDAGLAAIATGSALSATWSTGRRSVGV